jgi:hypothetical protein
MVKYYKYGKDFINYTSENGEESGQQLALVRSVYVRNWKQFIKRPLISCAFIVYTFFKYLFGGIGFFVAKIAKKR